MKAEILLIGDVAKVTNLSTATIRRMEQRGIIQPSRTPGGFRVYSLAEIKVIEANRQERGRPRK